MPRVVPAAAPVVVSEPATHALGPAPVLLQNEQGDSLLVQPTEVSVSLEGTSSTNIDIRGRVLSATNAAARQLRLEASARNLDPIHYTNAAVGLWQLTQTTACDYGDSDNWVWTESPSTLLVNAVTWTNWIDQDCTGSVNITLQGRRPFPTTRTAEEQAAYAAQRDQQRASEEKRRAARVAAMSRAEILLREHLTEEQRQELDRFKYFTVRVVDRKTSEIRFYRIHEGRSGNVHQVDARGVLIRRLCCHPVADVPNADTMLAQKLWLETMEAAFLALANKTLADGRVIHGSRSQEDALLVLQDEERARRAISLLPANAA